MIKIQVVSAAFTEKHGTSKKSGNAYSIREQEAWAHVLGEDGKPLAFPVMCKMPLEEKDLPYPVGMYTLDPRSVLVGDFGRLGLARVKLVPLANPK